VDWAGAHADAAARVDVGEAYSQLPSGSLFPNFECAVRVLNCAPTDLSYDPLRREVQVIRGRSDSPWKMQPVRVLEARWNYLVDPRWGGPTVRAEPAFWIGPVFYRRLQVEAIRLPLAPVVARPLSAMPLAASSVRPSRSNMARARRGTWACRYTRYAT
jgi:hypothetical protein